MQLVIFSLLCTALFLLSPSGARAQTKKEVTTSTNEVWAWQWEDDGWKKRLEIRGRAEFTDDYTDIASVAEGGSVRIEEVKQGTARRLEIARDASGGLRRTYYLNNQARALDEDARRWIAGIVTEAVRDSAVDADRRIGRIFERRGLAGVLEEISLTHGDYARRIYFGVLLKNRSLNASALQTVLREAARQLSSDYEQAQLLTTASDLMADRTEAVPAYFEAVATIKSDYERRRLFSTLLKRYGSNREVLVRVLKSTATFSSDYEKRLVLTEAAGLDLEDSQVAAAFFQTVATINSDYEHRIVLSTLAKKKGLGPQVLSRMLESAARISSDYEKATFLVEASSAYANDARLRTAFMQTTDTIKSDYERGRVLASIKNR